MKHRLILGVALFTALASSALATSVDVTLKVRRFYDPACGPTGCFRVEFSGAISSGAAGEYVAVMWQTCGSTFSTAVEGATTSEGGHWESDPNGSLLRSGTYRAKWKDDLSDPINVRLPARIWLAHFRGGRHRVTVSADSNLLGRFVELQRLSAGRWTRFRRARLEGGSAFVFYTTFTVRKSGLRLRLLVPSKTAAPCHLPSASETFVS